MKKVALVLSSGGPRGFAYIGAIEELESRGYEITSIAGTSIGSLIGGMYAAGKLPEVKDFLFSLNGWKVFGLMDISISRNHLVKGDKIIEALQEIVPDVNIEDLPIPYKAIATDLLTGEDDGIFNLGTYIPKGNSYEPSKDRVFVVFDRDLDPNCPELRTREEYHRVLDMCEDLGYVPVVSTPMFELWLLLHHEDADVSGIGPTLLYKDAIEDMLEDLELYAGKRITRERFDRYYRDTFPLAVEASRREPLTTDLRSLENMTGTRVGVELADLAGIE